MVSDHAKLRTILIDHKVIHENFKANIAHTNMTRNTNRVLRNNQNNFIISAQHYDTYNKITENASILWSNNPNIFKDI